MRSILRRWSPPAVAAFSLVVILYNLLLVLFSDLRGAPFARDAAAGRLHGQFANVARFPGDPERVRRAVWRAAFLDENPPQRPTSWQEQITRSVRVAAPVRHVVVLPSGGADALVWALPGAFWAAYAGAPVVFVAKDSLGADARERLRRYNVPAYVAAPAGAIAQNVVEEIGKVVPVERVSGNTPAAHAVAVAEYRDPETGFGWGRVYDRRNGCFAFLMTTPAEAAQGLAALPLAAAGAAAFLYAGNDGGIPGETDRYVWKQRPDWFEAPSEGPFRRIWVVGDRVSYAAQSRLNQALDKGPYPGKGPTALGPLEGLLLVWMAFGFAAAIFVAVHGNAFLRRVPLAVRVAWIMAVLLVPLPGIILYLAAYRHPEPDDSLLPRFRRTPAVRGAAAAVLSFGYGAPLMIAAAFLLLHAGLPVSFGDWSARGYDFLLGSGMFIMMALLWALGVLVTWALVQYPLYRVLLPEDPPETVSRRSFESTSLSMSAVSLGLIVAGWWLLTTKLPLLPRDDELLFTGSLWLAALPAFLLAWPLNMLLAHAGATPGGR